MKRKFPCRNRKQDTYRLCPRRAKRNWGTSPQLLGPRQPEILRDSISVGLPLCSALLLIICILIIISSSSTIITTTTTTTIITISCSIIISSSIIIIVITSPRTSEGLALGRKPPESRILVQKTAAGEHTRVKAHAPPLPNFGRILKVGSLDGSLLTRRCSRNSKEWVKLIDA